MTTTSARPTELAPTRRVRQQSTGPLWWFRQVFSWLLLFLVLGIVAVMIVVPRVSGGETFTVLTGSMRPGLQPGDLLVIKATPVENISIGSVVSYQLNSGLSDVVTHRVVGISVAPNGERNFQMQGDANNTPDAAAVRPVQIRGVLWYSLPFLGYLNSAISWEWHIWLLTGAVAILIGYTVFMLLSAWRDHRRGHRHGYRHGQKSSRS